MIFNIRNIKNYFLIFEIHFLILEDQILILENTDFCPQWLAISFVSFRFDLFRFVLFRFVSICFVSFRSVSFRFYLFRFVSICFVPFRFCFVWHFTGTHDFERLCTLNRNRTPSEILTSGTKVN